LPQHQPGVAAEVAWAELAVGAVEVSAEAAAGRRHRRWTLSAQP
jgi:hypothetical protein